MLFVFGYRAAKIRSKKLSVLIHKSENHKEITSCTVAVHFQKIIDTGVSKAQTTPEIHRGPSAINPQFSQNSPLIDIGLHGEINYEGYLWQVCSR